MTTWDQNYGWAEAKHPSQIDFQTARIIIPARAGYQIIVRRIRGVTNNAAALRSGAATRMSSDFTGTFDIPGLELRSGIGEAVYASGATATSSDLTLQYAYTRKLPTNEGRAN